jgi:PadR family transcriptional regulator, regulatory protein PadR
MVEPKLTIQTIKVLGALASCPRAEVSGAEIGRVTKLPSGSLYPILSRLEQAKWLESHWEDGDPSTLGRPRRRFYKLTAMGSKSARKAFSDVKAAIGGLAWNLS